MAQEFDEWKEHLKDAGIDFKKEGDAAHGYFLLLFSIRKELNGAVNFNALMKEAEKLDVHITLARIGKVQYELTLKVPVGGAIVDAVASVPSTIRKQPPASQRSAEDLLQSYYDEGIAQESEEKILNAKHALDAVGWGMKR